MTVSERPLVAPSVDAPAVGLVALFVLLTALAGVAGLGGAGWLAGAAYGVVLFALLTRAVRRSGARTFGPANHVTLARAVLVGGVTALTVDPVRGPLPLAAMITLASVALVLDGVDGQVARRTGTSTPLGARFDMEVDAFLILVLSVFVAQSTGWWVLAIGAFRYAFVAAAHAMPWLNGDLPPRFSRKVVAAAQGIVLAVAAAAILPAPVTTSAVALALAALVWSFGRDVALLWRGHAAGRVRAAAPASW